MKLIRSDYLRIFRYFGFDEFDKMAVIVQTSELSRIGLSLKNSVLIRFESSQLWSTTGRLKWRWLRCELAGHFNNLRAIIKMIKYHFPRIATRYIDGVSFPLVAQPLQSSGVSRNKIARLCLKFQLWDKNDPSRLYFICQDYSHIDHIAVFYPSKVHKRSICEYPA